MNAIDYCTSWELKIRMINRMNEVLLYDQSRETQMMNALGGEYQKLNSFYGTASFYINDFNKELLEYLKANRHYVSDYKERDNQYRVSFLRK